MNTLEEQAEITRHFADGGCVKLAPDGLPFSKGECPNYLFDFIRFPYTIVKPKKVVRFLAYESKRGCLTKAKEGSDEDRQLQVSPIWTRFPDADEEVVQALYPSWHHYTPTDTTHA